MNLGIGLSVATSYQSIPAVGLDLDAAIAALFGPSDEGAWYDPSDLTTLYQDAAGTTPVTGTGQPVGLMLDKSKGLTLGSERVPDASTWTGSGSWSVDTVAGRATLTNAVSGSDNLTLGTLTGSHVGQSFQVEFTIESISGGGAMLFGSRTSNPGYFTSAGTYAYLISVTLTGVGSLTITPSAAGVSCVISGITVKELPGNHATQSTSTARPTLQLSGSSYYLDFDGVDDWMSAAFASVQAQPNTLSLAYKFDATSPAVLVDSPTSNNRHAFYIDGNMLRYFNLVENNIKTATLLDEVATLKFDTISSQARINGVLLKSADDIGPQGWSGVVFGADYQGLRPSNGRIYGYVGVNRTLDPDEITNVESYLADKTGAFTAPVITGVPTISVS